MATLHLQMVSYQVCLARERKLTTLDMTSNESTWLHSATVLKAVTRVTRSQAVRENKDPPYGLLALLVIGLYESAYTGAALTLNLTLPS